ncbi:MAG: hypothetical protein ACRDD7_08245 [Peptostreptococcaceae bacterium]
MEGCNNIVLYNLTEKQKVLLGNLFDTMNLEHTEHKLLFFSDCTVLANEVSNKMRELGPEINIMFS